MLKLNPGFITERRSCYSHGVSLLEEYHQNLHGTEEVADPHEEILEGCDMVVTVHWLVKKVR